MWYGSPCHPWCLKIGISSWEGLSGDFSGDGEGLSALREWIDQSGFRGNAWRLALAELGVDDEPLANHLAEHLVEVRQEYHVAYPEARPVLEALGGRCRLGLLTNGAPLIQRAKLAATGLADYFDSVIVSGEVGVGKPDAKVFELMLMSLGAEASKAIMIGNSLRSDVGGAKNAGIRSVWVNRTGERAADGTGGDYEVANLSEVPEVLER